jgi:hypothetical protein
MNTRYEIKDNGATIFVKDNEYATNIYILSTSGSPAREFLMKAVILLNKVENEI